MNKKNKILTTIGLGTLSLCLNIHVGATSNYQLAKANVVTQQAQTTSVDYEKLLSNQTLVDQNNKVNFVNTLDDKTNLDSFFQRLDFLKDLKSKTADFSSNKYNLNSSEIKNLATQINNCDYRNWTTCFKNVIKDANSNSTFKSSWNQILIFLSQVLIGLNILFLGYKLLLLVFSKINKDDLNEN